MLPSGKLRISRGKKWNVYYAEVDEETLRKNLNEPSYAWEQHSVLI